MRRTPKGFYLTLVGIRPAITCGKSEVVYTLMVQTSNFSTAMLSPCDQKALDLTQHGLVKY